MCSHLAIRVSSIHVLAFCRYPPSRHLETSRLELSRILGPSTSHDLHGSQHLPSCVSIRHYLKHRTTLHAILPSMPLGPSAPYYRSLHTLSMLYMSPVSNILDILEPRPSRSVHPSIYRSSIHPSLDPSIPRSIDPRSVHLSSMIPCCVSTLHS